VRRWRSPLRINRPAAAAAEELDDGELKRVIVGDA
jgi:hypothetical protein